MSDLDLIENNYKNNITYPVNDTTNNIIKNIDNLVNVNEENHEIFKKKIGELLKDLKENFEEVNFEEGKYKEEDDAEEDDAEKEDDAEEEDDAEKKEEGNAAQEMPPLSPGNKEVGGNQSRRVKFFDMFGVNPIKTRRRRRSVKKTRRRRSGKKSKRRASRRR